MDLELLARLFFHEGWSKTQISRYLGCSRTTVRRNLKLLEDEGGKTKEI